MHYFNYRIRACLLL